MSHFRHKQFEGIRYTFEHLAPMKIKLVLDAKASQIVDLLVNFGCHCFTEKFNPARHTAHHRYVHKGELRAFSKHRHACSRGLPAAIHAMLHGTIYQARGHYAYYAHITLDSLAQAQQYAVFFDLKPYTNSTGTVLRLFVKSAYLKSPPIKPTTKSWRFVSLAGYLAGIYPWPQKTERQKKKAP